SSGTPGGTRRFGPAKPNGLARSEKIGSVRNVAPSMRTSMVEWPIHVMLGLFAMAARSYGTMGAAPGRPRSVAQALRRKKGAIAEKPGRERGPLVFPKRVPS